MPDTHYGAKARVRPGLAKRPFLAKRKNINVGMTEFMSSYLKNIAFSLGFRSPKAVIRLLVGALMAGILDIDEIAAKMIEFRWADLKDWPNLGGRKNRENRNAASNRARAKDFLARAHRDGRSGGG